jgi:putative transposase
VRTSSSTGSVRYDANHLHERIATRSSEIVIPPKRNRKVQRSYDVDLYKERNLIERLGNELKQFRRAATRYDKLLANSPPSQSG